ncbi:hypothetical protein CQZ99_02725 [Pseudomonas poae]|uniref:Uncharacterized protein n=2 Tax=Pseudomonas poae TaxID=200451 RepID=A0A2S9EZI8_9PSED|nr:hypothetical protein CQZ97_09065 [Pseudomonas poae]PRC22484.1 hypothetical protein CQZ99_02725 [Pseudomonas poae]
MSPLSEGSGREKVVMEEHLFIHGLVGSEDIDARRLASLQVARDAGDSVLKARLVGALLAAIRRGGLRYGTPDTFDLPKDCMLWQWLDVFLKALQYTDFQSWAAERHLDLGSVQVRGGNLHVNEVQAGRTTARVMLLSDESGWRNVAPPINAVIQIIDPEGICRDGLGDPSTTDRPPFSLRIALAFYGYPIPENRPQAQVMVDELQRLPGFPVVDSGGHIATAVLVEQAEQVKDCATMARELESILQASIAQQVAFEFLELYRRRIKLDSGSFLAQAMNLALRSLLGVSVQLNVEKGARPSSYYFSALNQTLIELEPFSVSRPVAPQRLAEPDVDVLYRELLVHAQKLGTDVYADGAFSLASLLTIYGREVPGDTSEARVLIASLEGSSHAPAPYVHASAHSVRALLEHRRYIGLLNNRYWMGAKLEDLISAKADTDTIVTANVNTTLDMDSPLAELTEVGRKQLLAAMQLNEFQAIRTRYQLDPEGHVLVSQTGYVGGQRLGGNWVDLNAAIEASIALTDAFAALALIARRIGGALRSNGNVTLEQALKFYRLSLPATVQEARALAQQLHAVPLRPNPAEEYWNALGGTFASVSSPLMSRRLQVIQEPEHFMPRIGSSLYYWPLLRRDQVVTVLDESQREQLLQAAGRFMAGSSGLLFERLAGPVVGEKKPDSVRAEADLLLAQMLAGPEAQTLADLLAIEITWKSSAQAQHARSRACRHSLVLAALILTLDAQACRSRSRIAGVDLAGKRFWGASLSEVLRDVEASLEVLHTLRVNTAVLAAHLLLSGMAPECLVRDVPPWVAYMTSQLWVYFKHCNVYLEGRYPGSSRRLAFDTIVGGGRKRRLGQSFWALKAFSGPVVDWARANGLLPLGGETFTEAELARAKAAWESQNTELHQAFEVFHAVLPTRRALALADLRNVFPQSAVLERSVLIRSPDKPEDTRSHQRVSLVDLHLNGQLISGGGGWRSTLDSMRYEEMTERFHLLRDINQLYGAQYVEWEGKLWSAYFVTLQYCLSLLKLSQRQHLEYGELTVFTVSRAGLLGGLKGGYGILVLCRHPFFPDCVYEVFPTHMHISERFDLPVSSLAEFADTSLDSAQRPGPISLLLDWRAYSEGIEPRPGVMFEAIVEQVGHFDQVTGQAGLSADDLSVPASMKSSRISSLCQIILGHSLFSGGMATRLTAGQPISLEDAITGRDICFDFQQSVKCRRPIQI